MMAEVIQVIDKPFDEMSLEELKLERRAHGWVRYKMKVNSYHLTTKLYALEELPLYTKEEYTKMYEDGEISKKEYQTMGARMAKRKNDIAVTRAQIKYGFAVFDHENAICTELDELIDIAKTKRIVPYKRGKDGKPYYDPRKHISWSNHNAKNKTDKLHPPSRAGKMQKKWSDIKKAETSAETQLRKMQPLATWDRDKLKQIARDRGVYSDPTMLAMIAEELHTTVGHARKVVNDGKMTWGEIILIASLFEMTPMEFCDCFLSGVFQEVVDGKWVAVAENKDALRAKLPATKAVDPDEESQEPSGTEER